MGWICVTDACEVSAGIWNNEGIAYYSIGDDIVNVHDAVFSYLTQVSSNIYMFLFFLTMISVVVGLIVSIRLVIMKQGMVRGNTNG